MKATLALIGFVSLFALLMWFGWNREVDKYRICRSLGHGSLYCIAAGDGK